MEYINLENIGLITGFLLILTGIFGIITRKNLIKIVISFSIFDTGIHVVMVSLAYIKNSTAPIIDDAVEAGAKLADPVPQALVLTAIVIGLGVTALMLAYVIKLYKQKGSLDINNYSDLKW